MDYVQIRGTSIFLSTNTIFSARIQISDEQIQSATFICFQQDHQLRGSVITIPDDIEEILPSDITVTLIS